ncbi:MAG: threonine/serine exporter family protein [Peptococcaceae bacterium]|nr:threonine/serine exporter family protein [Peptococcaceae bacterium]
MSYFAAFFASFFFAILYNVRGRLLIYSSLCGVLGWWIYNLLEGHHLVMQFLVPTMAMCLYAEFIARRCRAPVMVITTVGILPIVPGKGVYYTIDSLLNSQMDAFYMYGINTLLSAGAMAFGLVTMSSLVRLLKMFKRKVPAGRKARRFSPRMR